MALRADAPIDDFGLINDKALRIGRCKARRKTNRTLNINRELTPTANEVMVVISHPSLVKRRPTSGLYAAKDSRRHKRVEIVVNRLTRHTWVALSGGRNNELRIAMLALCGNNCVDSQPGLRDSQPQAPQALYQVVDHNRILPP